MTDERAPDGWPGDRLLLLLFRIAAAIGGGLVVFLAYQLLLVLLLRAFPESMRAALAISQAVGLAGGAAVLLLASRAMGILPAPLPRVSVRPAAALGFVTWTSALTFSCIGLLIGTFTIAAPDLLRRMLSWGNELYEPLLRVHGPWDVAAVLLVASVVPAVFEELLFRGAVQRLLMGSLPRLAAIGITAAFFSIVHVEPLGLIPRFILGVALGVAYERTGSLVLPILMHAAHNLVALGTFSWESEVVLPSEGQARLLIAGCASAGVLLAFLWWRALRALPRA